MPLVSLLLAFLVAAPSAGPLTGASPFAVCVGDPEPPPYYAIDLKTTRRVPGSERASGVVGVAFKASPFGVALSPAGEYLYTLDVAISDLAPAPTGAYVVWVTTPDLSRVEKIGVLDDGHRIRGEVAWNKFLVVVSHEAEPQAATRWSGPIVLRGLSRSGRMHTMAGHGPYDSEPCAVYGY
ncbi:hypothetical protein [Rubrivirga sp. IMCC45206]|uniref:hypothetical protein n=1 Tax=Rubrivirga sp. IMCC45206 TaxID=3391614 RepID=UPI00398FD133